MMATEISKTNMSLHGILTKRSQNVFTKAIVKQLLAVCIGSAITMVGLTDAIAGSGSTVFQVEFSTGKSLGFRSISLGIQNDSEEDESHWQFGSGLVETNPGIPLYSVDVQSPGLFNLLLPQPARRAPFGQESESADNNDKPSPASVLAVLGITALLIYGIKDELDKGCSGTEIILTGVLSQGYGSTDWCRDE